MGLYIDVYCEECNRMLVSRFDMVKGEVRLFVEPCQFCLSDARDEGEEIGERRAEKTC